MIADSLKSILLVGSGSFIRGAARYLVSVLMKGVGKGFPWATLTVNLVGCFLIGLLWGWLSRSSQLDSNLSLFLMVGLCGGFTTFSTFSKEAMMLLQNGSLWNFAIYVAASIVAGILCVAGAYLITK